MMRAHGTIMLRLFARLSLVFALAGCDLPLSGVHIVSVDAATDPGSRDGSTPQSGDGDGDGAEDAGNNDTGSWPTYVFDFDQPDGPPPAPWHVTSKAKVRDHRLCIPPGESVELAVEPHAYGYVRVDLPAQDKLVLEANTEDGVLFDLRWQANLVKNNFIYDVTLNGAAVGKQVPYAVKAYEALLDFADRTVQARARGDAKLQTAGFVASSLGTTLNALVFRNEQDWKPHCIDHVVVAASRPGIDPFKNGEPVSACAPTEDDAAGYCVVGHCCNELVGNFQEHCGCAADTCACPDFFDPAVCLADCVQYQPSHSAKDCTSLCRFEVVSGPTSAGEDLLTCVDTHCAGTPDALPIATPTPFDGVDEPPAGASKRLRVEAAWGDQATSPGTLVEVDLRTGERSAETYVPRLGNDRVTLYAAPHDDKAILFVRHDTDLLEPNGRVQFMEGFPDEARELTEVALPEPVVDVLPSANREAAWVLSQSLRDGTWYLQLVQHGQVLRRHTYGYYEDFMGFGPEDRYAFRLNLQKGTATIVDFAAGTIKDFALTAFSAEWPVWHAFKDSLAVYACGSQKWQWFDLEGAPIAGELPKPSCSDLAVLGDLVVVTPNLYQFDATQASLVAPLPAEFDVAHWTPVSTLPERTLYALTGNEASPGQGTYGLRMADAHGGVLAEFLPTPTTVPQGASVTSHSDLPTPYDVDHGLITACHDFSVGDGVCTFDAYSFDGTAFTSKRVLEAPYTPNLTLFGRGATSSLFVVGADNHGFVYDIESDEHIDLPATSVAGQLSWWGTYPEDPPRLFPP